MKQFAVLIAVVAFVLAVLYFTGIGVGHHVKHAIVFLIVAVLALLVSRMSPAQGR